MQRQAQTFFTLHRHIALHTCTSHSRLHSHCALRTPPFISSHLVLPKLFSPHLTSSKQVHLTRFNEVYPSNASYYKACAQHVPVLLCTTTLAQNASQYFLVLLCTTRLAQSTKARPSTTLYYKACTEHIPVLLRSAKLAHKALEIAAPKLDLHARAKKRL